MQLLGAIQKWQVEICGANTQDGRNPPLNRPSAEQNRSEFKVSWICQEPVTKGKYANVVLWVKNALTKFVVYLKSHTGTAKKRIIVWC